MYVQYIYINIYDNKNIWYKTETMKTFVFYESYSWKLGYFVLWPKKEIKKSFLNGT